MATPAMGIGVFDVLETKKSAVLFQYLDHDRIGFPDSFAEELWREGTGHALSFEEASGGIDRASTRATRD